MNSETSELGICQPEREPYTYNTEISEESMLEVSGDIFTTGHAIPNTPYRITIKLKRPNELQFKSDICMAENLFKVQVRGPLKDDSSYAIRLGGKQRENVNIHSPRVLKTSCSVCPIHHLSNSLDITRHNAVFERKRSVQKKICSLIDFYVRSISNSFENFESYLIFPEHGLYDVFFSYNQNDSDGILLKVTVSISGMKIKVMDEFPITEYRNPSSKNSSRLQSQNQLCFSTENAFEMLRVGSRGRGRTGQFTNPQDITYIKPSISSPGILLATDSNNQSVQSWIEDSDYRFKFIFGDRGRKRGQLFRPTGIENLPNSENCFIADYENRWISVYNYTNGKFLSRFGTGKLLGPKGLATDGKDNIYVVDNKSSSVFIFQTNGRFVGQFGTRGCGESQLAGPHFCALNSFRHTIISDFHNHAIKVFDSTGQFLYSFGSNGEGNGQFNAPTGVAVDSLDNIIVCDWGNSRLQVFDRHGTFLQCINTSSDPLYGPQGICINPINHLSNQIFVADSGNHCIKVFKYENFVKNMSFTYDEDTFDT